MSLPGASRPYSLRSALAFVAANGVVLASAKGPAPRLIEVIAGEPIRGNWWSHPRVNEIYNILAAVQDADDILVCKLLDGKVTLVHRCLWPALVRLATRLAPERIAQAKEEHTAGGRHVARSIPFPRWVPASVLREAEALSEGQALAVIEPTALLRVRKRGKPAVHTHAT